ncbi:sensor histidine kinase [Paenibacillaceae bacterium WGS1546]|uniref:cache domain-containing sensor histidine kinase n=1 Tax=Cohnella sp. WGS1546 TaxID=3366810 RepID=UPI00372D75E2
MRALFRYPTKLFTLMVLCFIGFNVSLLLVSAGVFYSTYSDLAYREIRDTKKELLEETSQKLSNYVAGIQDTARFLVTNELIRSYLSTAPVSFYDFYSKSKDIHDEFQKMLSVKTGVHSIELYTDWNGAYSPVQDRFLYSYRDAEKQGWHGRMEKADGFWVASHAYPYENGQSRMVSYVQRIIGDRGHSLGIVKINIPDAVLFNNLSKRLLSPDSEDYYIVMDSTGRYISSTLPSDVPMRLGPEDVYEMNFNALLRGDSSLPNESEIDGRKYHLIDSDMNSEYWRLAQLIPRDVFFENGRVLRQLTIALIAALILVSVPIAFWISKKLTSPIYRIVDGMHALEKGDFNVRVNASSSVQEYMYLTTHFNRMVLRLKQLVGRLNKEHRDRREAELQLLHAQIKPHFLYNTLDMIHWRALDYQAHEISQMVHQLSRLFRIGLSNDKWYVSVKDELDHARCYIAIQKFRQNFDIVYSEHAEPDLYACLIPKIVIQPFLENAVIHGFGSRADRAEIRVTVEAETAAGERRLLLSIDDNGVGFPAGFDVENADGIGIRNVIDRIHLYCGRSYGVKIERLESGRTRVALRLPLVRDEEELNQLTRSLADEYDSLSG